MIKTFIALVLTMSLMGCGGLKLTDTQTVYVPVTTKCKPTTNITEIKEYAFSKAKKEMSLYEKSQLMAAERDQYKGQNIELRAALAECTK